MSQLDLFQPSTPDDTVPVHAIREQRVDKGKRIVLVKCGAPIPASPASERRPSNLTNWSSLITCPDCLKGTP